MLTEDRKKKIIEIISQFTSVDEDDIADGTTFRDDLGFDDLDLYDLEMELEEEFDYDIDFDDIIEVKSVEEIFRVIGEQLEQ